MSKTGWPVCPYSGRSRKRRRAKGSSSPAPSHVRRRLPEDLQVAVTIMYVYGWRLREVIGLERRHLDLTAGTLTLDPGSTKNGDGRVVVLTADLAVLLAEQVERVKALERKTEKTVRAPFHT
jgi:integrase